MPWCQFGANITGMNSELSKPAGKRRRKEDQWPKIREVVKNQRRMFLVDARIQGKGERFFFDTKVHAETKADALRVKRVNEGKAGVNIPERLRVEALVCQEKLLAVGATLSIATEFYLRNAKPAGGTHTCKVATAELLAIKKQAGKRESYLKALKWSLGRFNLTFGERNLNEVSQPQIEEWLAEQKFGLATRRAYIRDVGIVFNFAVKRNYCVVNPVANIERPVLEDDAPEIFTVAQASALLTAAETNPDLELVPAIAIGLFAGLRTAELRKLEWKDVDFESKVIEVTGRKSKTRQRRLVDISDNLATWLLPFRDAEGLVAPNWFRGRLEKLREKAGMTTWPKNGMRHSFVSYHMAQHQNPNMTALQAGHDVDVSFSNYRNLVKPKEAAKYWSLAATADTGKIVALEKAA